MAAVLYGLIWERKSASEEHNSMISLGHALPLKLLVQRVHAQLSGSHLLILILDFSDFMAPQGSQIPPF